MSMPEKLIYLDNKTWERLEKLQWTWNRTISISNLIERMVKEWFANYDLKIK